MNRMKGTKILVIVLMLATYPGMVSAEYTPWHGDVLTGDALISAERSASKGEVYNGAQGGAFFLIRFFQIFISPQDGDNNCRHVPTCSTYGKQAVLKHGAFLGSILAGDRLLRCNPFYPPSKDPVPDTILQK